MIQIVRDLGRRLPRELPYEPVRGNTHLLILDVENLRIYTEEMDSTRGRRYVWVGNRKGSQTKDRLIVKDAAIRYLIFTTPFVLPGLLEQMDDPGAQPLVDRLNGLQQNPGVLELKTSTGQDFRMIRVERLLDTEKRSQFMERLHERVQQDTGEPLPFPEEPEAAFRVWAARYPKPAGFEKAFEEAFRAVLTEGVKRGDTVLWTYRDEEGVLAEDPAYRAYVTHTFQPQLEDAEEGTCHLCGRRARVTAKTGAFHFFKFFNTDKPGFAPSLNPRHFPSSFGLCASCYEAVLYGDRFAMEHLRTRLAGLDVVLLPHPVTDREDLKELADLLTRRLKATDTVDQWQAFQKKLEEQVDLSETWEHLRSQIFLNLVFFEKSNSAIKVLKILQEVPPSRLDELDQTRRVARDWALQHFFDVGKKKSLWDLDLQTQYSLLPPHKDTRTPSLFLAYLEALLYGLPFPREGVYRHFLRVARAHALGSLQTFRRLPSYRTVEQFMVQTMVFARYAEILGVFPPLPTGGGAMVLERVPVHLKKYVVQYVPEGKARGLFLLGYVVGLIGKAQREGIAPAEAKSPPILNAVAFTGMDEPRIRRLVNQVADRMRHYLKGWAYDEGERVLAAALTLLSRNDAPPIPPYENTYWVLAGYGFARLGLRTTENQEEHHD